MTNDPLIDAYDVGCAVGRLQAIDAIYTILNQKHLCAQALVNQLKQYRKEKLEEYSEISTTFKDMYTKELTENASIHRINDENS